MDPIARPGRRNATAQLGLADGWNLPARVRSVSAWANDRILTTAADLTDDEFRKDEVLDLGSAFQTIRHLVDVDWSWREGCIGNDVCQTYVWDHGFTLEDLSAPRAFCLDEDVRLRYLTGCVHAPGNLDNLLDAFELPGRPPIRWARDRQVLLDVSSVTRRRTTVSSPRNWLVCGSVAGSMGG